MASPLRRPRVTWMASQFAALDLVQHGLAGAAERLGGVGEREIAVGDVGHEAGADVVGEPDPPGRGRGGLLAGQQPVAQPAADGEQRDAELGGGLVDRHQLRVGVGRRGGGDAGALARGADAGGGERQPGPGPVAVAGEDRRDLVVGVMRGEAADQLDGVLGQPPALGAAGVERARVSSVRAPPSQQISTSARLSAAWTVTMTSRTRVRSSSLRSRSVVRRRVPQPRQIAREPRERGALVVGQRRRPGLLERGELAALALDGGERVLERAFEGAGDEAVLGLAGVELAARAVGLELGALDGEALAGEPLVVLVMQLARPRRRSRRRRPG